MESVMQFDSDDDTLAILEDYQDESGGEPESRSSSISGRSTTIASIELKTKYLRMEACKRVRSEGANSYSGRLFGSRHINDLVPKQSFEKSLFGFCIDELQLRRLRGRRQGLSYQAAAAQLEHRLSGLVRSENLPVGPQKRLRRMLHRAIDEGRWGPELLVRSFDDWDRSLFGKRLSGHVWLVWHPDDPRVLGSLGHVEPAESSHQAMIWLNCDQIFKGDPRHTSWSQTREDMFRRMLGAFLLSCCHAYLLISANMGSQYPVSEYQDSFDRCAVAVRTHTLYLLGSSKNVEWELMTSVAYESPALPSSKT